jgi:hypothetical protein
MQGVGGKIINPPQVWARLVPSQSKKNI